jgi:uncharacterized membrane protein YcaP (DUF421 family)
MLNLASLLEIIGRSVAVYIFIILAIRFFGKKELSQLSVIDLVFILLISNSVQNAMVGNNVSLSGGVIAALTLFIVNFVLKKIIYHSKKASEFIQGKSILLIYDGVVQSDNLKEAGISLSELAAAVREHGILECENVFLGMLEVDGSISIVSGVLEKQTFHAAEKQRIVKKNIQKKR